MASKHDIVVKEIAIIFYGHNYFRYVCILMISSSYEFIEILVVVFLSNQSH